MSASNVYGNFVSPLLAKGHSPSIIIIIIMSIQFIFAISPVHGSCTSKINLKCNTEDPDDVKWEAWFDSCVCSGEPAIFVTRAIVYDKNCKNQREANRSILKKIKEACDGRRECDMSQFDTDLCYTYGCMSVAFTCNSTADGNNRNKRRNRNRNRNGQIVIECNHTTTGITDTPPTGSQDTSTTITGEQMSTSESMDSDINSMDTKVVIIVVISVVAFVATVIAVTLCLLFFCCQKSPIYRHSFMVRRHRQQQHQGEYDYVDESKIKDMISSPEDSTHLGGVFCVNPQPSSTSHGYQNTFTSEYQLYSGISSDESPDTVNTTFLSSQPSLSVSIIPVTPELLKSASSNSGPQHPGDRYNTDQIYTVNAEDAVSGQQGHLTTDDLQQGIYSLARPLSPASRAGPVGYLNALSETGHYAHLTRPGEDPQSMENVYDG